MTTPTPPTNPPERITAAELRAALQLITEHLDAIDNDIAALRDGLTAAASHPQQTPAATGQTVMFDCNVITMSTDDNGQPVYKARGGQYQKFGVRIWPETIPQLGLDPLALKPGPNPVYLHLVALMGDSGPRKVIGLAK